MKTKTKTVAKKAPTKPVAKKPTKRVEAPTEASKLMETIGSLKAKMILLEDKVSMLEEENSEHLAKFEMVSKRLTETENAIAMLSASQKPVDPAREDFDIQASSPTEDLVKDIEQEATTKGWAAEHNDEASLKYQAQCDREDQNLAVQNDDPMLPYAEP